MMMMMMMMMWRAQGNLKCLVRVIRRHLYLTVRYRQCKAGTPRGSRQGQARGPLSLVNVLEPELDWPCICCVHAACSSPGLPYIAQG